MYYTHPGCRTSIFGKIVRTVFEFLRYCHMCIVDASNLKYVDYIFLSKCTKFYIFTQNGTLDSYIASSLQGNVLVFLQICRNMSSLSSLSAACPKNLMVIRHSGKFVHFLPVKN